MPIRTPKGSLLIIIATLIWGVGYVAKASANYHIAPLTFNAVRFGIGGIVALGPAMFFLMRQKSSPKEEGENEPISKGKSTIAAGVICGLVLCLGINLQQFGIARTSVANASFITSLHVIIVPVACYVIFRQRAVITVWVSVAVAIVGMYFLSLSGGFYVNIGDVFIFLCAFGSAAHLILIGRFSPVHSGPVLVCVQFFVVSIISLVLALIFEAPSMAAIFAAAPYVLYTGVLSSGVAYILVTKAQKTTDAAVTSVLCSFEAVVATVAGWFMLSQFLTARELLGCVLIFIAILAVQVPVKAKLKDAP